MTTCQRDGHRWEHLAYLRSICTVCGVLRIVIKRHGRRQARVMLIQTHKFQPDAEGRYCVRCNLPKVNARHLEVITNERAGTA